MWDFFKIYFRFRPEIATPGGPPTRSRPSSKMTKYVECWGADKPFANITDSKMAKNIGLAVSQVQDPASLIFALQFLRYTTLCSVEHCDDWIEFAANWTTMLRFQLFRSAIRIAASHNVVSKRWTRDDVPRTTRSPFSLRFNLFIYYVFIVRIITVDRDTQVNFRLAFVCLHLKCNLEVLFLFLSAMLRCWDHLVLHY